LTFPALHLAPLGLCLVVGSVSDVAKRRVPNVVSLVTAVGGVVVQSMDRGGLAALSGLGAAALTIALLYLPWQAGGLGGGDLKLAAATAVWVGIGGMIRYALAVAACGGVVSIVAYLFSGKEARREMKNNLALAALEGRLPPVPAGGPERKTVPYGVAIAAGALITFLIT
jgi:Flp pilus assembly protein protease CpaA